MSESTYSYDGQIEVGMRFEWCFDSRFTGWPKAFCVVEGVAIDEPEGDERRIITHKRDEPKERHWNDESHFREMVKPCCHIFNHNSSHCPAFLHRQGRLDP